MIENIEKTGIRKQRIISLIEDMFIDPVSGINLAIN